MCRITEKQLYLYNKATELMRIKGIMQDNVGYELLRKAIVFYRVSPIIMYHVKKENNKKSWRYYSKRKKMVWVPYIIDSKFIENIKEGLIIPNNKDLNVKIQEIGRDPAMQWMIETLKASGYIQEKGVSPEVQVKNFIQEISNQL